MRVSVVKHVALDGLKEILQGESNEEIRCTLLGDNNLVATNGNDHWQQGYQGYNQEGIGYQHSCSRLKMHL
jgi:hypothetical protein